MNTIINAIPEYVITAVVSTAICFAIKYAQTMIHSKALHSKTVQSRELWGFLDQVSATAVASLVSNPASGNEKFQKAVELVQAELKAQGFKTVNVESIQSAVQAAYEKSPLTPTKQPVDPVKEAIKTAPNRADKLLVTDGSTTQAKG